MAHFIYSAHAIEEIGRRNIKQSVVDEVLREPMQKLEEQEGLICYQSKIQSDGKSYLLRVMVNESKDP